MISRSVRYNPGFLDDEELIKIFVVRKHDFALLLETLRDDKRPANPHTLVVGPRGTGKTTLVRRVAAEIRRDPDLSRNWYPIVFSEESYEVCTPGEFWLSALFHLAGQTKDPRWQKAYAELRLERDETRLCNRTMTQLMDFADEQAKRLILIVENLNMLLGEQLDDQDAWDLRHTLQNEPRIMLLGTATVRFEEIEHVDKAWFEIINIHELKPLDDIESKTLWDSFTGEQLDSSQLRPVQILTGGSPRLISILAGFATKASFRELMDNLVQLIDDHTEYFKGQLDSLASVERKVFVALLDLWDPSTAKVIAQMARLDVSKTSSLLNRLVSKGAVMVVQDGRRKLYQAAERMYNIYYLMRRRSEPAERVRAVVTFMVQFYQGERLITQAAKLAKEACGLDPARRMDHYHAYEGIVSRTHEIDRLRILRATPKEFFDIPDMPAPVRDLMNSQPHDAEAWLKLGDNVSADRSRTDAAEEAYKAALEINPQEVRAWCRLGQLYEEQERYIDAKQAFEKAIAVKPDYRDAWSGLAWLESRKLMNWEQAEIALRKLIELAPDNHKYWISLAELLYEHLGKDAEAREAFQAAIDLGQDVSDSWKRLGDFLMYHREENGAAETAFRKSIEADPDYDGAWAHLGALLHRMERYDEAEAPLRKAVELNPTYGWAWAELGHLLSAHLGRYDEAEEILRKSVELSPNDSWAWLSLATLLHRSLQRYAEAEQVCRRAIEADSNSDDAWFELGNLLFAHLGREDDAEQAFRTALELNPKLNRARISLGMLYTHQKRYDKAENCYREAAEEQPEAEPLVRLGRLLHKHLKRYDEAEDAYRRAIDIDPSFAEGWLGLIELYLKPFSNAETASKKAQDFINLSPQDATRLNSVARVFYKWGPKQFLPVAENWARNAVLLNEDSWAHIHTLALILGRENKWEEALTLAPKFLDAAATNEEAIKPATEFVIMAASSGFANEALFIVEASQGLKALEPLAVGLRIYLEKSDFIAQEIFEVGQDIAKRIRKNANRVKHE